MNTNSKLLFSGLLACGGVLVACGDSSGTGTGGAGTTATVTSVTSTKASATSTTGAPTSTSTGSGGGFPAPPTLSSQLDRMGRPAINTAADETFFAGSPAAVSTDATRGMGEDAYNADKDPAHWATYSATVQEQLGILDALDAPDSADPKGCGNQLLAAGGVTAGTYAALANVLVNDRLWVHTKTTASCSSYLGVESKFLDPTAPDDCGGRRPGDDVIATTFTVVSGAAAPGLDDGITDPGSHQATFPYLVAPH